MTLRDAVGKYRVLSGGFARPIELAAFGLSRQDTERAFGAFDEDYHISRFFHFTLSPELEKQPSKVYQINGFPQSHIALDAEVESLL